MQTCWDLGQSLTLSVPLFPAINQQSGVEKWCSGTSSEVAVKTQAAAVQSNLGRVFLTNSQVIPLLLPIFGSTLSGKDLEGFGGHFWFWKTRPWAPPALGTWRLTTSCLDLGQWGQWKMQMMPRVLSINSYKNHHVIIIIINSNKNKYLCSAFHVQSSCHVLEPSWPLLAPWWERRTRLGNSIQT